MQQNVKNIKSANGECIFKLTNDEDEWFTRLENLDGFDEMELSIPVNDSFSEESWDKLPEFLQYIEENLSKHIHKALIPLTSFAKLSGYFNEDQQKLLDFSFNLCVVYTDNTFVLADRWHFDLDFHADGADDYARWFVSFEGDCISGIRRENA